jgi:hypothetical protein
MCGDTRVSLVIEALGHITTSVPGYAEDCVNPGLSDGLFCTRCQQFVVPQEVIPARGHNLIYYVGYEATCTEDGLTDGEFCNRCQTWIDEQKVIPAPGHVVVTVEGQEATCTEDGLTDGEYCEVCGEWLVPQEVIPAAHVVSEWQPCEYDRFGRVTKEEIVCTVCGLQLDLRIPAPEHSGEVIVEGYDATCEADGLTAGVYCEDCGEWVIPQEVIPGGEHIESDWTPVYDENGNVKYEEKVCERCGLQLDVRIPAPNGGNGNGNGGGVDIYDNQVAVDNLNVNVGCGGVIGVAGILPSAAFVSGMLLFRRRKNRFNEDSSEE